MTLKPCKKSPCLGTGAFPIRDYRLLLSGNRFDRALTDTGTAIGAGIRVDKISFLSFGNRLDRTDIGAGTAGDAFLGNHMSHVLLLTKMKVKTFTKFLRT